MVGRDEHRTTLVGHGHAAVVEPGLTLVGPPQRSAGVTREKPSGVGDALMPHGPGGLTQHVPPAPHLATRLGSVGGDRPQSLVVGDVYGAGVGIGVAHDDLISGVDVDGIVAAHPHAAGVGVEEHPVVAGGREHRYGDIGVEGVAPAKLVGLDVVPDDRRVGRGVGEQHASVIERHGVRRIGSRVVVAGRAEGIEFDTGLSGAAQASGEERAGIRPVDDVVARGDDRRCPRGRGGGGLELLLLQVDGARLVDPRELAETVGEEIGAVTGLRHLAGVARGANGVELADGGVDAGVPLAIARLQGPDRGVDLGRLLRVESRPHDARRHDQSGRDERGAETRERRALHRSTPVA